MTIEEVKDRLSQFGYEVVESDNLILNFIMSKVVAEIKRDCNILLIPSDIEPIVIDMICGEFLFEKKSLSPTNFFIDLSAAVKSITEGDTKVDFAIGSGDLTNEARLDKLIDCLRYGNKHIFNSVRCLSW
jgi:hypothetical protein